MIALGIDPGIATTGYGVVREERDGQFTALGHGVILTPKTDGVATSGLSLCKCSCGRW